jgi:hypothetical protein
MLPAERRAGAGSIIARHQPDFDGQVYCEACCQVRPCDVQLLAVSLDALLAAVMRDDHGPAILAACAVDGGE